MRNGTLIVIFSIDLSDSPRQRTLASSWPQRGGTIRKDWPTQRASKSRLRTYFQDLRPHSRGAEVGAWLAAHRHVGPFVIIDDEDDCYGKYPLFQPASNSGLTPKMAAAVQAFLKGEQTRDMRRGIIARGCQAIRFAIFGHKG